MQRIVIIGGGASGLIAALTAKNDLNEVTILERNEMCGKKLSITGNGRCNFYNENQDISNYFSSNKELLNNIINTKNTSKVIKLFNDIGIVYKVKNGWYYPFSNQATTIRNALIEEVGRKDINIINNFNVGKVEKKDSYFSIYSDDQVIKADKVIIAIGSKASINKTYEKDQYNILENLSHTVIKCLPTLVPLKLKFKYGKDWSGVRTEAIVKLIENDKEIASEEGEIQLTDYGISGICTFNISGLAVKGLENKNTEIIRINFLPFINGIEDFYRLLDKYDKELTISQILDRIINYKLGNAILKYSNIAKEKKLSAMTANDKEVLANNLLSLDLEITGHKGFDSAQVSSGGISLSEINLNTMESKKIKNLYFTGEVLDADGKCGGYNLTFAFVTAILAGEDVSKNDRN